MLRHFVYLDLEVTAAENHPTFGQVHPIFLLALPFVPVLVQAVKVIPELWREKPSESTTLRPVPQTGWHINTRNRERKTRLGLFLRK